jgi:Protein of unknown function (DUF3563)
MNANRLPIDDLGIFTLIATALAIKPPGPDARQRDQLPATAPAAEDRPPRRSWLDRLDQWLWKYEQRAVEAHLAKAKDVYDLEARIRDLERGALYRYY